MKRAPKRKPRTFKVWVLVARNGEPYAGTARHSKENVPIMDSTATVQSATLTLSGGKGKGKCK